MGLSRAILIWGLLGFVLALPMAAAAWSPLLQWRDPVYILGGFAGIVALALLLLQPLLAGGYLPGCAGLQGRRVHRAMGLLLLCAVVVHVGALWVTSPPDVIDVLLFRSPTPFAIWGALAMWAVFGVAAAAALRDRLGLRPHIWRRLHTTLAGLAVLGCVGHALLIEGAMETATKIGLCALALIATGKVIHDLRIWRRRPRKF